MAEADFQPWERLWQLIWGCAASQAVHVAVKLGLPEILEAGGPQTAEQLASATAGDAWALETILRTLAAFEVLEADAGERYGLTATGRLLLRSAEGSFAGEADAFFGTIYRPLGALLHMAQTGEVAFDHVYGMTFYDYLPRDAPLAAHFYDTMTRNSHARYGGLSSVCDFAGVARLVDVGGGEGALMIQILHEHPAIAGLLVDLPVAVARARERLGAAGLLARCETVAGDFLESVPPGGDLYLLAQILNNWRDAQACRILANCRAAMAPGARLVALEPVYFPGARTAPWRTLVSLGVMAQRGGRTRSESQLRALFEAAGLRIDAIRPLPASATCAVEASLA